MLEIRGGIHYAVGVECCARRKFQVSNQCEKLFRVLDWAENGFCGKVQSFATFCNCHLTREFRSGKCPLLSYWNDAIKSCKLQVVVQCVQFRKFAPLGTIRHLLKNHFPAIHSQFLGRQSVREEKITQNSSFFLRIIYWSNQFSVFQIFLIKRNIEHYFDDLTSVWFTSCSMFRAPDALWWPPPSRVPSI